MTKPQRTILLVDDSSEDRAIIKHFLLRDPAYDFHVMEEESGELGLTACLQLRPECLLLDYNLPDLDGLQFLTRLAEHAGEQAPAVVMLTGSGNEMRAVEAMKRGAQDYLRKGTFTTETLTRAIANAIEKVVLQRALKAYQEQIQERETRLRLALHAARMGTWEWDVATGHAVISPETEALAGLAPGTFGGSPAAFLALVHSDDRARVQQAQVQALRSGTDYDQEFRIVKPNDLVQWVALRGEVMRNVNGRAVRILGVAQEITARKAAEAEREQLLSELQRINAELQQFAYIVSHDLGEPLRTMRSYTQLLARELIGKVEGETEEYMAFVTDAAQRMQQMLADLLAYTRAGQTPEFTAVDCEAVLTQVLSSLDTHITEHGAEITHDSLPTVRGDATRLRQVLQNLISNALKFCEAQPPRIHIAAVKEHHHYMFSVRDNGIGIDPQQSGRLFQVFQRLHARSEYPGSGIGLAICKRIVEQHGGRIWVESQPRKGSIFYFTISDM